MEKWRKLGKTGKDKRGPGRQSLMEEIWGDWEWQEEDGGDLGRPARGGRFQPGDVGGGQWRVTRRLSDDGGGMGKPGIMEGA